MSITLNDSIADRAEGVTTAVANLSRCRPSTRASTLRIPEVIMPADKTDIAPASVKSTLLHVSQDDKLDCESL
jgi:hypothetical protein